MQSNSNWLVHDHGKYDEALAGCEAVAEEGLWDEAVSMYRDFVEDIKVHMLMEDEVLYPFYMEQYGDPQGEIAYLTAEHDHICSLLHDLDFVIRRNDFEHFLASLKPLHKILNQHNDNEEYVFLSMDNNDILMSRDKIVQQLNAVQDNVGRRIWNF